MSLASVFQIQKPLDCILSSRSGEAKPSAHFVILRMYTNCLIKTDFTNATLAERNSMSARTRFSKAQKYRLTSGCMPFTLLLLPEKAFPQCS
jgi:hypothetical protein